MRFGTPTPRSDSGTLEEFEAAVAKHKKDSSSGASSQDFAACRPNEAEDPAVAELRCGLLPSWKKRIHRNGM